MLNMSEFASDCEYQLEATRGITLLEIQLVAVLSLGVSELSPRHQSEKTELHGHSLHTANECFCKYGPDLIA